MNRPRSLLLTAAIMIALMVVGWIRMYYRSQHPHLAHPPHHLHSLTILLLLVINSIVFICIYYYVQGRNWARIAVLITSILSILYLPLQMIREGTAGRIIGVAWSLLGAFFLYWLNTRFVREFFKRGGANVDQPKIAAG
jgi:drug/metabolite transporter (DMT)-like permease